MDNDQISALRSKALLAQSEITRKEYHLIEKINAVINEISESKDPGAQRRLQKLRATKTRLQATASQARRAITEMAKSYIEQGQNQSETDRRPASRRV